MRDVPLFDGRAELTKEAMNALAGGVRRGTKTVTSDGTVVVHDTAGGRVLSTGRGRTDNGLWARLTSESPAQPGVYAWTEQVGTVTSPGVISWADHPAKLTGTLTASPAVEKGQKSGLVGAGGPVWLRRGPTDPSPGGLGQTWVFDGGSSQLQQPTAVAQWATTGVYPPSVMDGTPGLVVNLAIDPGLSNDAGLAFFSPSAPDRLTIPPGQGGKYMVTCRVAWRVFIGGVFAGPPNLVSLVNLTCGFGRVSGPTSGPSLTILGRDDRSFFCLTGFGLFPQMSMSGLYTLQEGQSFALFCAASMFVRSDSSPPPAGSIVHVFTTDNTFRNDLSLVKIG